MGLNSSNNGTNTREEVKGKKEQTAVQKQVADTKEKVHKTQYGK